MNANRQNYLNYIWQTGGSDQLKRMFRELVLRDEREAMRYINADNLGFPVLFILMHEISARNMYSELSQRNKAAIHICAKKIYKYNTKMTDLMDRGIIHQALNWMFLTGKDWSGPSDGHDTYDAVIDDVSALLITAFEDKTIMRDIVDLIFKRHRQGLYIHDLVWSFFQVLDPDALALTANHLLSANPKDAELAGKLLGVDIPAASNSAGARKTQRQFLSWIEDNKPYLYLTGEHFQMTSKPKHLDADAEAKYLGKEISPRYRAPVEPLTEAETACLRSYRASTYENQELLTNYSHRLRSRDTQQWYEWMQKQPAEQVLAARNGYEAV